MRATTSASNLFRRQLCPGSERLEAGLSEEDTEQSKEGTLLHGYDANPKLERSVLKPYQRDLLRVSRECDEFVIGRAQEQFKLFDERQEFREVPLTALWGTKGETPGTADRLLVYESAAIIIDKKFGFKVVTPASANVQLRSYAIGCYRVYPRAQTIVAITQPRLSFSERITMAAYTEEEIRASEKELSEIRFNSAKPDAPLVPGELQCRYCKARAICPALREKLGGDLSLIEVHGTVEKRKVDAERLVKACSDEQLDRLLVALQMAEFVKDTARDEARRRVAAGQLVTWKIGKETENTDVADPRRAIALLSLKGDLTKDEIYDACSMSLGPLQEKYREKKKCTWKEAKAAIRGILSGVIETTPRRAPLSRK